MTASRTSIGLLAATPILLLFGPILAIAAVAGTTIPAADSCTDGGAVAGGPWRPPLTGPYRTTSAFGPRFHPVLGRPKLHTGIDLVTTAGPGTVVAASAGTITTRGFNNAYGNQVVIDHGGGTFTRYAHLASFASGLAVGDLVDAGQPLGREGATGWVTGRHLHYEVIRDGTPIDPRPFMADHDAPLTGHATSTPTDNRPPERAETRDGGAGPFTLPDPGTPVRASRTTTASPIPTQIRRMYEEAGRRYRVPWQLLAGIGMAETTHGANNHTSSAGARGLMQFMPATFTTMGVDGDRDGRADITNDADSIHSAAHYLTRSGVHDGPAGVRRALFAYNHADWYLNDVLTYAHAYATGDTQIAVGCPPTADSLP